MLYGKKGFLRHPDGAAGAAPAQPPAQEQVPPAQPEGAPATEEPDGAAMPATGEDAGVSFSPEQQAFIEKMLDRRTHKLGNQIKTLETQLADRQEKLAKHVSSEELRQMELDEKEAKLAEREAELDIARRQRYATEAIVAAGLGQDSKNALRLREFVMAEDEAGIQKRVGEFKTLLQSYVNDDVQRIFKAGGRLPEGGGAALLPAAEYDQKIKSALQAGNMAEAAYWTRQKAQQQQGG